MNYQHSGARTLFVMAGGTGGHIFPALAVAAQLREEGWNIIWLGSKGKMEERLVPQHGFKLIALDIAGVRGKGVLGWCTAPFKMTQAILHVVQLMKTLRPDVVIGFGGYTALAGGISAFLLKKPLIIHEQNAVAGLTNRVLARLASPILTAFPKVFPTASHVQQVGNPVRLDISAVPPPIERFQNRTGALKVLVVGGSLGAQVFNERLPLALARLPSEKRPLLVHQAGEKHIEGLREAYQNAGVVVECRAFIEDMAQAYAEADIVICRAGALTIAELACAGVASILVPFPHAVDDHQTKNAAYLAEAQAAVLIPQPQFTLEKIVELFETVTRDQCAQMANRARELALPHATEQVAASCRQAAGLLN